MHRVGYRAVKSPECVKKKSKIAHNFFMTKATDLKTIFLKSPWKMGVDKLNDRDRYILLSKNVDPSS